VNLQIVAVANGEPREIYLQRGFGAFKDSCRRYGFEPVILGWAQKWGGLGSKPKLLKKAIEDGTVNAKNIIWADAFDVAFARNPNETLEEFGIEYALSSRGPHIIWNCERDIFPNPDLAQYHPETDAPYRYLNSGLSIGFTDAYLQILTEMKVDEWVDDYQKPDGQWVHRNDQLDVQEKFLFGQCGEKELPMGLDQSARLFQTMTGETLETWDLTAGKLTNLVTGNQPHAFHWNGPAKTAGTMDLMLRSLSL
jgi:hypothetical protein